MSPRIRKTNLSSEFFIIDQKALLHLFLLGGQSLLITRRKTALKLCVTVAVLAVEWGLAEEIFLVKIFFLL